MKTAAWWWTLLGAVGVAELTVMIATLPARKIEPLHPAPAVRTENPDSFRQDMPPLKIEPKPPPQRYTVCGIAGAENCWETVGYVVPR